MMQQKVILALCLTALAALSCQAEFKISPPVVKVYSRNPGKFGQGNVLICHAADFHPPNIQIQLMKDGEEIPNAEQTDLAFKNGWRFHLTRNVGFTPERDHKYTCKVTHGNNVNTYAWEPNM